jgi:hypothetical protein
MVTHSIKNDLTLLLILIKFFDNVEFDQKSIPHSYFKQHLLSKYRRCCNVGNILLNVDFTDMFHKKVKNTAKDKDDDDWCGVESTTFLSLSSGKRLTKLEQH